MDHIAIMKKSWGLTKKILTGEKSIESRWYKIRHAPWNRIEKGDTVYFKDSGEPVTLKVKVQKALQFANLNSARVKKLLQKYARADGIDQKDIPAFFKRFKDKKYCVFVFLEHPERVHLFHISKKGFGAMASWITVGDINSIMVR